MAKQMVKKAHDSKIVGYMGIFKMVEQIQEWYWWPNKKQSYQAAHPPVLHLTGHHEQGHPTIGAPDHALGRPPTQPMSAH
jgi:hypothetical protein